VSRRGLTRFLHVAQVLVVLAALWFASQRLAGHWGDFRREAGTLHPNGSLVIASAAAVLAGYGVLIHAWRVLVGVWGTALPFWIAARVWTVSNLTRFLPASALVTTGAIGVLGSRAGVSPVAAGGSAVLGTLLNIGTGFVVVVLSGAGLLRAVAPTTSPSLIVALALVGGGALLALPFAVAPLTRLAARLLRRSIDMPALPPGAVATAVTANVVAWFLYGLAFRLLALAFFPGSGGGWIAYTAVFTGSYLAGLLALLPPSGLGVREAALTYGLTQLGLLTPVQAAVVVVASRLVLTLLEILPGVAFLAAGTVSRPSPSK
jgi:hypothetical protein